MKRKKHEGLVRVSMKGIYSDEKTKLKVKVYVTHQLAGEIIRLIGMNEKHIFVK